LFEGKGSIVTHIDCIIQEFWFGYKGTYTAPFMFYLHKQYYYVSKPETTIYLNIKLIYFVLSSQGFYSIDISRFFFFQNKSYGIASAEKIVFIHMTSLFSATISNVILILDEQ